MAASTYASFSARKTPISRQKMMKRELNEEKAREMTLPSIYRQSPCATLEKSIDTERELRDII